jgi:hypothetical protein
MLKGKPTGQVKIGWTSRTVVERRQELTAFPGTLELVADREGCQCLERYLHRRGKAFGAHLHREFFLDDPRLLVLFEAEPSCFTARLAEEAARAQSEAQAQAEAARLLEAETTEADHRANVQAEENLDAAVQDEVMAFYSDCREVNAAVLYEYEWLRTQLRVGGRKAEEARFHMALRKRRVAAEGIFGSRESHAWSKVPTYKERMGITAHVRPCEECLRADAVVGDERERVVRKMLTEWYERLGKEPHPASERYLYAALMRGGAAAHDARWKMADVLEKLARPSAEGDK